MILPDDNISINSVRALLGEASTSVYDVCRSTQINRWSKFKPVNGTFPHGDKNMFYGLAIQKQVGDLNSIAGSDRIKSTHVYSLPTACRLGDFRGYNSNSPAPFQNISYDDNLNSVKLSSTIWVSMKEGNNDNNINIHNLVEHIIGKKAHLGLLIRTESGSKWAYKTELIPTDAAARIEINLKDTPFLAGETIEVIPFATNELCPLRTSTTHATIGITGISLNNGSNSDMYRRFTIMQTVDTVNACRIIVDNFTSTASIVNDYGEGKLELAGERKIRVRVDAKDGTKYSGGRVEFFIQFEGSKITYPMEVNAIKYQEQVYLLDMLPVIDNVYTEPRWHYVLDAFPTKATINQVNKFEKVDANFRVANGAEFGQLEKLNQPL